MDLHRGVKRNSSVDRNDENNQKKWKPFSEINNYGKKTEKKFDALKEESLDQNTQSELSNKIVNKNTDHNAIKTNEPFKNYNKENIIYVDKDEFERLKTINRYKQLLKENTKKDEYDLDEDELAGINFDDFFEDLDDEITSNDEFMICKVIRVDNIGILVISKSNRKYNLTFRGLWENTELFVGDVVHLYKPVIIKNQIIIAFPHSHIVVSPHLLISSSKLNGFSYCNRRSVLDEYFSSGSFDNESMIVGSIVHYLFQRLIGETNLKENLLNKLDEYHEEYLRDKHTILDFYEKDIKLANIKSNVRKYYSNIISWIQQNKKAICVNQEENLYSIRYGLRGNIDLTMKDNKSGVIYPLELKTGKEHDSHTMQILAYQLLLSDSKNTDLMEGLILYLKNNFQKNVKVSESFTNGLIDTRNAIATALRKSHIDIEELPISLDNEHKCNKCEQALVCSLLPKPNLNSDLYKSKTSHLSCDMTDFFVRYFKMIMIEYSNKLPTSIYLKISTSLSTDGIRNARFVNYFPILNENSFHSNKWRYDFCVENFESLKHSLNENDNVIISNDDGSYLGYVTGYLTFSGEKTEVKGQISVIASQKSELPISENVAFRIDKLPFMSSIRCHLNCLTELMRPNAIGKFLREIILNGTYCAFSSQEMHNEYINDNLNKHQIDVINRILGKSEFHLVKGYPGTGKTVTIKHLVEHYASLGKRVLVASYTHSAVQNILGKIDESIKCLYIESNSNKQILGNVRNKTLSKFMENITNVDDLSRQIETVKVVGVTCLSANHPILSKTKFDLVVIDEAGQITLPISLNPLFRLRYGDSESCDNGKFVLFGDIQQLPPLLTDEKARQSELSISLFERLCTMYPKLVSELKYQYRMNSCILNVADSIFCNNLLCGSNDVANFTIDQLTNYNNVLSDHDYLNKCSSGAIEDSVILLDVNDIDREIELIKEILNHFNRCGLSNDDVGIISPFNSRVNAIKKAVTEDANMKKEVETNTIDRFQGRDKHIVMISFSNKLKNNREENDYKMDILHDGRRLNVCLTRSKCKLILIGNWKALVENYVILKTIREKVQPQQYFDLSKL